MSSLVKALKHNANLLFAIFFCAVVAVGLFLPVAAQEAAAPGTVRLELIYALAVVLGLIIFLLVQNLRTKAKSVREKDELNRQLQEEQAKLTRHMQVIEGLSKEYGAVWLIDVSTMTISVVYDSGYKTISEAVAAADGISYADARSYYARTKVVPEDRESYMALSEYAVVKRQLAEVPIYKVNFRRFNNDEAEYVQYCFALADAGNPEGNIVLGFKNINSEVREEKMHKEALATALRAAEEASKAKTIFLNNMSHDIRTPMNAILGFAGLMEKELDNPEAVAGGLKKIKSSGEYLLGVINNVLDMARIESGYSTVNEEFYDIFDAGKGLTNCFEAPARGKQQRFFMDYKVQHRYIFLDKAKVQAISVNIISNAIKYTPDGGTIEVRMEEIPASKPGYAAYTMTVKDNGIGMSEEFQKHMFDMFSRERNTTESRIIGTGLGMAIVKRLVDLMGGTLEVESRLGEGTTFRVTMEHKIVEHPEEYLQEREPAAVEPVDFSDKRILLTEDNELNAEIAMAVLEEAGFTVDHAEDGAACVEMLEQAEAGYYDVILMDIQMPRLNGYEATEKIRQLADPARAQIPIVAMTANAFEEDRRKCEAVGMNGFCSKPIEVAKLHRELERVLR